MENCPLSAALHDVGSFDVGTGRAGFNRTSSWILASSGYALWGLGRSAFPAGVHPSLLYLCITDHLLEKSAAHSEC
jgi:hypothetical protein